METVLPKHLVSVLHSPPETAGLRSRNRVAQAAALLDCATHEIVNLYARTTRDVASLNEASVHQGWSEARGLIKAAVLNPHTTDVLLAYGVRAPTGRARLHFPSQVTWLDDLLKQRRINVWTVAGRPSHPSRWQRATALHAPGQDFNKSLRELLVSASTGLAQNATRLNDFDSI
jgi:hypothetical protein